MNDQNIIALECIAEADPASISPAVYRGALIKALAAIKELVAERDDWRRSLDAEIDHHALTTTLLEKAEAELAHCRMEIEALCGGDYDKIKADLAAARSALRIMRERVEKADEFLVADGHGEGSSVRECLADAIAAARAEGGE